MENRDGALCEYAPDDDGFSESTGPRLTQRNEYTCNRQGTKYESVLQLKEKRPKFNMQLFRFTAITYFTLLFETSLIHTYD